MNRFCQFLGLGFLGFLIGACETSSGPGNIVPKQVVLIEKSSDTIYEERGIDAEEPAVPNPLRNGIKIEWVPSTEDNVDGYRVYQRSVDSTGTFQLLQTVPASDSQYVDASASLTNTNFYYVASINDEDEEGPRSKVEFYKLLPKPDSRAPINNELFTGSFDWFFDSGSAFYFSFRIERALTTNRDEFTPVFFLSRGDFGGNVNDNQSWTISELQIAGGQFLQPGDSLIAGFYRWRIDLRDFDDLVREGAESVWAGFEVQ